MAKQLDLYNIANAIADCIQAGIDITITKDGDTNKVNVNDPNSKQSIQINFLTQPATMQVAPAAKVTGRASHPSTMPTVNTFNEKKKTSRWYSRFNIEKNFCRLTVADLRKDPNFENATDVDTTIFANRMARLMGIAIGTAKKHIQKAVKMGIINRQYINGSFVIELAINEGNGDLNKEHTVNTNYTPEEPGYGEDKEPDPNAVNVQRGVMQGLGEAVNEVNELIDETVLP